MDRPVTSDSANGALSTIGSAEVPSSGRPGPGTICWFEPLVVVPLLAGLVWFAAIFVAAFVGGVAFAAIYMLAVIGLSLTVIWHYQPTATDAAMRVRSV